MENQTLEQEKKQEGFVCSGDCLNCSPAQRTYCAAQMAYNNMRTLSDMQQAMSEMQATIDGLTEKIENQQGKEDVVCAPKIDIAQ